MTAMQAREALEAAIWAATTAGTAEAVDAALAVADAYAEAAADDRIAGHVASREAGRLRLLAVHGERLAAGKPGGPRPFAGAPLSWEQSRRVGAAVRALRLQAGVTQAGVANAAGITQAMASQLELGRCRWRKRDAEAAARLLGTNLAGLLARHLAVDVAAAVPPGRRAAA